MYDQMKTEQVCVTLSVGDWAKVIAAIGTSRLELFEKDLLNATIYNCVTQTY